MLTQYKNITQIKQSTKSLSGERIDRSKTEFASYDANESIYSNKDILNVTDDHRIELHVYTNDSWLTGNHKIQFQTKNVEQIRV